MHSWSGGRCLDLGIGEILGVWHWFHPTLQLDQLMLLLLLLPGKWLRLEKKTGYCPEILVPDREMWLGWPMNAKGWWNRPRGRMLTCFRHIFSMLEPAGTRSCDEKFGIVMSGWPDSAWSASWRMIVRICIVYLWASFGIILVSMENLLWISWEPKVNAVSDKNQRKMMPNPGLWENLNTCWVSRIIPEYLMMYKEVCYLLLLQIGVQGHLNYKARIWSAFRWSEDMGVQAFTF